MIQEVFIGRPIIIEDKTHMAQHHPAGKTLAYRHRSPWEGEEEQDKLSTDVEPAADKVQRLAFRRAGAQNQRPVFHDRNYNLTGQPI